MNGPDRMPYRGRLAPSPTGLLHLGHARTFWTAHQRCAERGGVLVLRNEDLDVSRCRQEFAEAMIHDLHWLGIDWSEGPDKGGPFAPYRQSDCLGFYEKALSSLASEGHVYPCRCSRREILIASQTPQTEDDEPLYPGTCRPSAPLPFSWDQVLDLRGQRVQWRFRVPSTEIVKFDDGAFGSQSFQADVDFGDFVVWRRDWIPAYQLAVVVDDFRMSITEVVRGADLLKSTARQILLYQALGYKIPAFYHCSLVLDDSGVRLAKRHDSLSLRTLRERGCQPEEISLKTAVEHRGDLQEPG